MSESQNNDNQTELTDLALSEDQQAAVKSGAGTSLASVTDLVIDPFNPSRTSTTINSGAALHLKPLS